MHDDVGIALVADATKILAAGKERGKDGPVGPEQEALYLAPDGVTALRDAALAVSAPHGRTVKADGVAYGHVIDPVTGEPVRHTRGAGVTEPQSLVCDACSTALLVRGADWWPEFRQRWTGYDAWVR